MKTETDNVKKLRQLDQCAEAMHSIARALNHLGLNDAATRMGAIEVLAKEIKEGSEQIASALHSIASAIELGGAVLTDNHHRDDD